ncbi:MFS transporter [Patulibacter sp. SYSU D01012]|uniref:MFS transporter n=1 Tax=Patulibacter sp. SYSU D01012 TaxID=2817381 RepID=UPI001B3144A4|nr:MFS transporter [Patulibacter sp. SYSU D01012]
MSTFSQLRVPAAARASTPPGRVLAIVCAAVVLSSLDLFIVNVALPDIGADYGEGDLSALSWVLNAYAIVFAALLVVFGRAAERWDRRRAFLAGVAVFTLASAACGAAPGLGALVAFRVVQAAGAALLIPASLGLVLATAPPERRQGSVRTWTAVGGLAAALGPVVGGVLVAADWRWVFLVNVPIGLAAIVVGLRALPDVPGHPVARPNVGEATLVTVGIGLLTLGLVEGERWGWGSAQTLGVLGGALLALVAFAVALRRSADPLVDPALLRVRAFVGASGALSLFSVGFGAMLLSIVLWEQEVWGWSALRTGLAVAPGPLLVPVLATVAGRLIPRVGAGRVGAAGALVFAAGLAWWALSASVTPNYASGVLPGMLLTGVGVGLTLPTLMGAAAAALPPAAFATGSGVTNMLRQVGLALGVAVFVAVVGSPAGPAALEDAYARAWWVLAAFAVAAAAVALVLPRPGRAAAPVPATDAA